MDKNTRTILEGLHDLLSAIADVPEARGIVELKHRNRCAGRAAAIRDLLREHDTGGAFNGGYTMMDTRRVRPPPPPPALTPSDAPKFPCPGERPALELQLMAEGYPAAEAVAMARTITTECKNLPKCRTGAFECSCAAMGQ